MRAEFETGKEDSRRQFGVKLLGAVISVALLVAVVVAVGGSEKNASLERKGLYVGSENTEGKIDMDAIEREVFESTGLRVKVVRPHELAALGKKPESFVKGDATYGTFALKYTLSGRFLSSHNGQKKKLTTENSVAGNDDKWQIKAVGTTGRYEVQSMADTTDCAAIEGDGDVRLWNDCDEGKTRLVVLRLDTNTAPRYTYNDDKFMLYGYKTGHRFIKVSASGSVSSGQNPGEEGIFEFVNA